MPELLFTLACSELQLEKEKLNRVVTSSLGENLGNANLKFNELNTFLIESKKMLNRLINSLFIYLIKSML